MKFFQRNKVNKADTGSRQDKVAGKIAGWLLSVQNRFAAFMNARVNSRSGKVKRLYLVIFCLLFGGFSFQAFLSVFSGKENKSLRPGQVAVPRYYNNTEADTKTPFVSDGEIKRIERFKKYMDSLTGSPA